MLTTRTALHGESLGHVRRLPNDDEHGFGRDYVTDKSEAFIVFLADCAWPSFYFIRAADMAEAYEHAEVVLCDVDEEAESRIVNGEPIEDVTYERDASITGDGRIRTTWALQVKRLGCPSLSL